MSEDKKALYVRQLSLDGSNLGRAITTLSSIENRWGNLRDEIKWVSEFLRGLKTLLTYGGWEGYSPDHSISIPDLKVDLGIDPNSKSFKTLKKLEALPKLQKARDEAIKVVYNRLKKIRDTHKKLIIAITTRRELWMVEEITLKIPTPKEEDRIQNYISDRRDPNFEEPKRSKKSILELDKIDPNWRERY